MSIRKILKILEYKKYMASDGFRSSWSFDNDTDDELVSVMNKHLPNGWKNNQDHRRQIYRVVENFLKTPQGLEIKEREKRARTLAFKKEEDVDTEETIADAVGRRLYTQTPYRDKFRRDVEQIEIDYLNR
jgi:hypothetical protein